MRLDAPQPHAAACPPWPRHARPRARWWVWALLGLFTAGVIVHLLLPAPPLFWRPGARTALAQMQQFALALEHYRGRHGAPPQGLAELTRYDRVLGAAYFERIPSDPWGTPYAYAAGRAEQRCSLASAGEDGTWGTADDLRLP